MKIHARAGRNIFDEKLGQTLRCHLIDGTRTESVPVRVLEILVDPRLGLFGHLAEVQFPSREHHLSIIAVDNIAVQINILKLVVRTN